MAAEQEHWQISPGGLTTAQQSTQGQRAASLADRADLETLLMEAGYHSCFGCKHRGETETCAGCSVMSPHWEANARWLAAQKHKEAST